jgi:hypothetical protein
MTYCLRRGAPSPLPWQGVTANDCHAYIAGRIWRDLGCNAIQVGDHFGEVEALSSTRMSPGATTVVCDNENAVAPIYRPEIVFSQLPAESIFKSRGAPALPAVLCLDGDFDRCGNGWYQNVGHVAFGDLRFSGRVKSVLGSLPQLLG